MGKERHRERYNGERVKRLETAGKYSCRKKKKIDVKEREGSRYTT